MTDDPQTATRPAAADRFLASLVESSDDAIIGKTIDGEITSWNAAAERLYGYTPAEAIGRPLTMLIPPEGLNEETAILDRVLAGERLEHYETERVRKDGLRVLVSLTVSPVFDENGRVVGVSAISRDLSGRQMEQQRIAATEERFRRALLAFTDVSYPARILQSVVDAARELVNAEYAALGIIGPDQKLIEFIHSGMDVATVERIGHLPEGHGILRTVIIERRPLRLANLGDHPASVGFPDHHPPMTSFLGAPINAPDGGIFGNIYLTNKRGGGEFTERDEELIVALASQAAVAIENSRAYERERTMVARLQQLAEAAVALTEELDLERVLQKIVDLARGLVGAEYAALGVLSRESSFLDQFIHSGIDQATVEQIGDLPRGHGVLRAVIVEKRPLRLRDLHEHPASFGFPAHHPPMTSFLGVPISYKGRIFGNLYLTNKLGAPEFSEEDEAVALGLAAHAAVAIENAHVHARDVGLMEQLREVNKAKSNFLSMVSHDLRQPITVIAGLTGALALHPNQDPESMREIVERIDRSAHRLDDIVVDLLELTRLEAGRLEMLLEKVDLRSAISAALDGLDVPGDRKIEVRVGEELAVRADRRRFIRVATNLLGNAVRHGGPNIAIEAQRRGKETLIVVSDDGAGVQESLIPHLFDRFRGTSGDGMGWGLGLAIVRAFTEAFGGEIWYEPGHPGSRFCVRLLSA